MSTDHAARLADLAGRVQSARAALRAAVVEARAAGMTEVDIAAHTGLSRTTVRVWLGKAQ